jgi:hypothetical protein
VRKVDVSEIERLGLRIERKIDPKLGPLGKHHYEILPGKDMTRGEFKKKIKDIKWED